MGRRKQWESGMTKKRKERSTDGWIFKERNARQALLCLTEPVDGRKLTTTERERGGETLADSEKKNEKQITAVLAE